MNAKLYIRSETQHGKMVLNHISNVIDKLNNKSIFIDIIYVTPQNSKEIKQRGIEFTPTLLFHGRKISGADAIIRFLTPPKEMKADPEINENVNEYLNSYFTREMVMYDDNPETPIDEEIKRKMLAFQKRRTEMVGVEDKNFIPGGHKISKKETKNIFNNDEEFYNESSLKDMELTPYKDTDDGAKFLEEYYNREADSCGRKPYKRKHPITS